MKTTMRLIVAAILLLAGTETRAENYKGTAERHGLKIEYSLSGGVVTEKRKPYLGGVPTNMSMTINGEVQPGATLTASCRKLAGIPKYDLVYIGVGFTDNNGKFHSVMDKKGDKSTSISYSVPSDATEVTLIISCGYISIRTTWNVVKASSSNTQAKSGGKQTSLSSAKTYSDQITHNGHTMKYTITGPSIKLKDKPELIRNAVTNYTQTIRGTVKPGQIITVKEEKISGKDKPRLNISFKYLKKGAVPVFSNVAHMIQTKQTNDTTMTYVVPGDAEVVYAYIYYQIPAGGMESSIDITANLYVGNSIPDYAKSSNSTAVESTTMPLIPSFNWNDISPDENCPKCKQPYSHYQLNDSHGTLQQKCKDSSMEFAELTPFEVIYFHNQIRTGHESQAWISHENYEECITLKQNSSARVEQVSKRDRWYLDKGQILVRYSDFNDDVPTFQLANCVVYPQEPIMLRLEQNGDASHVYMLAGTVEVLSIHGGKKQTIKSGQTIAVTADGVQTVQPYNAKELYDEMYKQFGKNRYNRHNIFLDD